MRESKNYYDQCFEDSDFYLCKAPEGFPALGTCRELSPKTGGGHYWYYDSCKNYYIKIHDFFFSEDTILNMSLPESLSVTYYASISGEELFPYRKLKCNVVKSYLGGYTPYRALIHRNVPIRSIGIEYKPSYYNNYLREEFGDLYQNPIDAFQSIDETTDFPKMEQLLKQLWNYDGTGMPAALYYDAKAAEALSLVFERHRMLNGRIVTQISTSDRSMLDSLASYIGDHYADSLSIETLSLIACMGTTKLKRCFKSYFNCTIKEYIQHVRIDQAEHLLAYTDLPINEIAQAVGYTATGRFAELFHRIKGVLPGEYRRSLQSNQHNI
ncbi:transcriptional regulator, AraC family [Lachnospiraceae bacterium KM106-2]|nr:transcriptional regulator, AraC family [Lachnospiraceae bacterium KM106-2]